MPNSVAIFVLGYRSLSYLQQGFLERITCAARKVCSHRTRLVFLDNYSCDGSVEYVLKRHPDFDVLMCTHNRLYCDGVNAGLRYIYRRYDPGYYILCDADNHIEDDTFLHLLERAKRDSQAGIIQPLVRSSENPDILYSCGHRYDENYQCWPMSSLLTEACNLDDLPSCSILSTLFRKEVFEQCGILDQIFQIYYESSDISFRARKAGWRCVCEPTAVAYHQGSDGLGINHFHLRYYVNRNWLIFWRLHDSEKFLHVRNIQSKRLSQLQHHYEASEFGIDAHDEAIRSGIEDGLQIADSKELFNRLPERIQMFDKAACVLLYSSEVCPAKTTLG